MRDEVPATTKSEGERPEAEAAHRTADADSTFRRSAPGFLESSVDTADQLDQKLNEAINKVAVAATTYRIGIMVTRLAVGRYIVRAHPEVPFGLIRQRHK